MKRYNVDYWEDFEKELFEKPGFKKAQEERILFIQSFKKVADTILKCERIEDFNSCMKKFS